MVYNTYRFAFDRVYPPEAHQSLIYEESARAAVCNVLQGYNASIIAFGQTGSGKTHTMTGSLSGDGRGIIPRAVDDVFTHIQTDASGAGGGGTSKYLVRASYLQIYNEVISDLLKPESTSLSIREDRRRGVHVDGLSEWVVRTPADVYALMERGGAARTTGATKLNELSSRSHAIFQLIVEKSSVVVASGTGGGGDELGGEVRAGGAPLPRPLHAPEQKQQQRVSVGKLNLVDLAGSERVHLTGAKGKRLEESKKINQSLSALGNVIAALTDPKGRHARPHIPYRDSKLTRILEDSLGGNCKTTFMAMVSPAVEAFPESLSTLKFAHRAKCVKNAPRVNEDLDHAALLRKYERELRRLRAELQQRSKDLVDKRVVLQLDEARRREQADKIAAITALERQSAEIARQKAAMSALQNKIASMQSQLLIGGHTIEESPEFQTLLAAEQARIRELYAKKMAELEAERRAVAEDKAAAERLKGLLIKQRDVMVALTNRLAERDEQVLQLQSAVEAAETRAKEAEDGLDKKMAELIAVRKSVVVNTQQLQHADEDDDGETAQKETEWTIAASPLRKPRNSLLLAGAATGPATIKGPVEVNADELLDFDSDTSGGTGTDVGENLMYGKTKPEWSVTRSHDMPEREALKLILEKKVLKLVGDVTQSLTETTDGRANGATRTIDPLVAKKLQVLHQLVTATVNAL